MATIGSSSIFAANNGNIAISATVPEIALLTAITGGGGAATLDQLGKQVYTDAKIGSIVIQSNDELGFTLTYDSATNGFLALGGTGTLDEETMPYTESLTNPTGTLGTGITVSGESAADPEGGVVSFSGTGVSPTHGRKYDLGITTTEKGLVQGSYSDTITITIANN